MPVLHFAARMLLLCLAAAPSHRPTPVDSAAPFPRWELRAGERYFRVNGRPTFVLGRNLTETTPAAFEADFRSMEASGESLVRLHLVHGIPPHADAGKVDEAWTAQWDAVFRSAARYHVAVIPVFSVWAEWNDGSGGELWHVWQDNPYNDARGGPAHSPADLLRDTPCRRMWLGWLSALVRRWSLHSNIVAWEPFSELDLLTGSSPARARDFVERAAETIRRADPRHRPISISLSGVVDWPEVFDSKSVNIVQAHPYATPPEYAGNLDLMVLDSARRRLDRYDKPVLLGECGLDWRPPAGTPTLSERATVGIRHAIWASAISGALAGRMLWWEDGYDKYEHADIARRYSEASLPVARFARAVSYDVLRPAAANLSPALRGGILAGRSEIVGWVRDARCASPDWPIREVNGADVSLTVPRPDGRWHLVFYSTLTGLPDEVGEVESREGRLEIHLPAFSGSTAFIARRVSAVRLPKASSGGRPMPTRRTTVTR